MNLSRNGGGITARPAARPHPVTAPTSGTQNVAHTVTPVAYQIFTPVGQPPASGPEVPQHPVAIARISFDRAGDSHGVERQEDRLLKLNARLGWGPLTIVMENDISGYKRRRVVRSDGAVEYRVFRPGLRAIIGWLDAGLYDGLLAVDSDRAFRDPYDLEDTAHVVRAKGIPQESVTGTLRLTSDGDLTTTRILTAVANKSSMDTARRVADARLDIAMAGGWGGGRRPFGFGVQVEHPTKPGTVLLDVSRIVEDEAARVVQGCKDVLSGVSLREQVAELNADGVKTVTGKPWATPAWRDILLRPRNAGLVVHQGVIVEGKRLAGEAGEKPLVDRATFDAVTAILTSPHRRTTPGPAPRWLGSGIYLCGHPACTGEATMRVGSSGGVGRDRRYGCKVRPHLSRSAAKTDEFVRRTIVSRLSMPDAVRFLTPKIRVDTAALNEEANQYRATLTNLDDALEAGAMQLPNYLTRSKRVKAQLVEVTAKLNAASGVDPVAGLAGDPRAAQIWDGLSLARRRAILRRLVTVTLLPIVGGRPRGWQPGNTYFQTDSIRIVFDTIG